MFNTALNADSRLWLVGCWTRAALLTGMWVTLAWAPVSELPRGFAQLLAATAGLFLGFAPPSRAMRVLRATIPVIFAGFVTFVLLPWSAVDTQVPLLVRILLSASPLVYYPLWAAFDIMLKASVTSLRNSQNLWRWTSGAMPTAR
jgi:hypothetical protein